jgi:hypothetical protein
MINNHKQAHTLMAKFASLEILNNRDFEFNCYYLEDTEGGFLGKDANDTTVFKKQIQFSNTNSLYFQAEVCVKLSPLGGVAVYTHQFQLDLTSLNIELNKLYGNTNNIFEKSYYLTAINETYHLIAACLVDYKSGADNYYEIAKIIYNARGKISSTKFGF